MGIGMPLMPSFRLARMAATLVLLPGLTSLRLYNNMPHWLRRPDAFFVPRVVKTQLDTPKKIIPVGRDHCAVPVPVRPGVRIQPHLHPHHHQHGNHWHSHLHDTLLTLHPTHPGTFPSALIRRTGRAKVTAKALMRKRTRQARRENQMSCESRVAAGTITGWECLKQSAST